MFLPVGRTKLNVRVVITSGPDQWNPGFAWQPVNLDLPGQPTEAARFRMTTTAR